MTFRIHFVLPGVLALLLAMAGGCGSDDEGGGTKPKPDAAAGAAGKAGTGGTGATGGKGGTGGTAGTGGASASAGASGTGGEDAGDGGDGGPQCTLPEDCPATPNECSVRTCDAGVCGTFNVAQGTPIAQQTTGDCKLSQCDGAGNIEVINDDTDLPDDNNDCTTDTCSSGTPGHSNVTAGTACGTGGTLKCDGQGQCVGCLTPNDCTGVSDECKTKTCTSGTCGVTFTAQGTVVSTQTAGDCKQNVCDGAGNVTTSTLTTDLPVDNNPCTDDVCTQSTPSNPPLPSGTACSTGGGTVCNGSGSCVQCVLPSQCPGQDTECQTRTCSSNTCGVNNTAAGTPTSTQTAGDCKKNQCDGSGAIASVNDDADLPEDNNPCTANQCSNGTPSFPLLPSGTSCGTNLVCDSAGNCVGCVTPADCPGTDTDCKTKTCVSGTCGFNFTASGTPTSSQTAGDCKQNQCDGSGNIVSANLDSDVPNDNLQCTGDVCTSGTPSNPPLASGTACNQNGGTKCDGNGACVQCLAVGDCGTNTECKTYTCSTSGTCSVSYTASGTPTSSQTTGDCKQNQCDGSGNIVGANLDTDLPNDNKQCTSDVCTNGVPSNPPLASGTACNESGGTKCNGSGSCVECLAASECGTSTTCKTYACSASGTCSSTNAPSGTPLPTQTPGDCQKNVCDGNGGTTTVNDDTDLPVDGKECTADVCTNGVPSHTNLPIGTACTGGKCDGNGNCVACLVSSDCGTSTECVTYSCVSAACQTTYTAAGTPVSTQTAGDCKHAHCDGSGNVVNAPDNTDLPVDNNQCTDDVCTNGIASNPPSAAGTPCNQNGGTKCDGTGVCVECLTGADCPSLICTNYVCAIASCSDGVKNGTESDIDCGGGSCSACASGKTCNVNTDCQTAGCVGGICESPQVGTTTPNDGNANIPVTTTITIYFTVGMDATTLTAQTATGPCTGTIQLSSDNFTTCIGLTGLVMTNLDKNATLTPVPALSYGTTYKIKVTTAAKDPFGNPIAPEYVSPTGFTTYSPLVCSAATVVISQVYGGGGNTGATYKNDFIELHNRGTTAVSLTGWSVQYTSATATNPWYKTDLSGTIAPGGYLLVQEAAGAGGTVNLPTPDVTGSIAMGAGSGNVALVNNTTLLPTGCPLPGSAIDLVGYGTGACYEGTGAAPALANTTAAIRGAAGCNDSNDNSKDFAAGAPTPRNTSSAAVSCACTANESGKTEEVDWCNLQFPTSLNLSGGANTGAIYGRLYEAGVTEPAGASPLVIAEIGYGPADVNPSTQSGWLFFPAAFNTQYGNDDEYQGSFTAPATPGSYRYTYRFSVDGTWWTYCDINGAGSNPGLSFEIDKLGVLTVN